jgi:pyruvate dehydrogenase E1 component alpha subunit
MYNEYTHFSETTAGDINTRATAFGIHSETVDGQDVRAVFAVAERLVARARAGEGPAFLQCITYRYHGHHVGDINREYYRSKVEEKEWMSERDPLKLFTDWLILNKESDTAALAKIEAELRAEMKAAVEFALASPYPDASEVDEDVYA